MSKKTVKKSAPKKEKSFEETLWDTANKLRGSVESSDWSGATKTTRQSCPQGERGGANQNGVAGFDSVHLRFAPVVLANGSMSTNTKAEGEIRQKMVENDLVDCMIALPGQLFFRHRFRYAFGFFRKIRLGATKESSAVGATFSHRNRIFDSLIVNVYMTQNNSSTHAA